MNTDELIAFYAARLDEDERWAKALPSMEDITRAQDAGVISLAGAKALGILASRDRVLREVAAHRAIVRRCSARMNEMDEYPNGLVSPRALLARQILADLAAVYSDHPDYRQEWAP
jgi:uncharacterized protein DUF6221